jgi:GNAT superfamily N-acetyltransferase
MTDSNKLPAIGVLQRLIDDALHLFYACGANYHSQGRRGVTMVLSGEPVADLNYITVSDGSPGAIAAFTGYVAHCDGVDVPFAVMLGPDATGPLTPVCDQLKLTHATEWPVMVCAADQVSEQPLSGMRILPVVDATGLEAVAEMLASAFQMPADSVARAMPPPLVESPSIDVFLGEHEGRVKSTVTVTYHGEIAGIWSMGTHASAMGQGVGKALLSRVMCDARERGIRWFFLGATPSGYPLYEKLGYRTRFSAQVWVRGETHQA